MQSPKQDFTQLQYQFAAHIRNPERHIKPEGVEERRMTIYRELFFNNVDGFISGGFPVLKSITDEVAWQRLVRNFFDQYRCHTPYFLEIAGEFIRYLTEQREPEAGDFPFMNELAHYEWVELALDTSEADFNDVEVDAEGDLLEGQPQHSPLAWSLMYSYPVHQIRSDYLPEQAPQEPTFLVVYRNREDRVKFMEINQLTARLLHLLADDETMTGRQALEQIAAEMGLTDAQSIVQGGLSTLNQLKAAGIILGTRISN